MDLIIRGDKIKVTDAMKEYLKEKISKLDKYIDNSETVHANIVVKVKNKDQIVEITIPLKSFILRSEETQDDFYKSVDKAVDKLERQIRKNKTRLMSKQTIKNNYEFKLDEIEDEGTNEKIEKRKSIDIKPMDEEEAILQMELLNHKFYMYKDSETNKCAVVYKREKGGYGILESE